MKHLLFFVFSLLYVATNHSFANDLPRRGLLGLSVSNPTSEFSCFHAIEALPNTPAHSIGIKKGNCIISIDCIQDLSVTSFINYLSKKKAGDKISIVFQQESEFITKPVVLGPRPIEYHDKLKFQYDSIAVNSNLIRVITTIPKNNNIKLPAIVYFTGLSCNSTELSLIPTTQVNALRELLYGLAESGYAVIRYDRSGVGDSQGDCSILDFHNEVLEAVQVVKYASNHPEINSDEIFAFGISNGGPVAALVGNRIPLKGIMVYGMATKSWFEYIIENMRFQDSLRNASPSLTQEKINANTLLWSELLIKEKSFKEIQNDYPEIFSYWENDYHKNTDTLYSRNALYFQQLQKTNLSKQFELLTTPVLALWGTSDFISREYDHDLIKRSMKNGLATVIKVEHADHYMREANSFLDSMSNTVSSNWNPEILVQIKQWLNSTRSKL